MNEDRTVKRASPRATPPGRLILLAALLAAALLALVVTAPYRARLARETEAMRRQRLAATRRQAEAGSQAAARRERLAQVAANLAAHPADPDAQLHAGLEYLELGDADPAVRVLELAAQGRPRDAATRAALGQAYEAARRLDRALDEYRAARRLAPGDVAHDLRLAALLSRLGWRREALDVLRGALVRAPNHAGVRIALAMIEFQSSDLRAAEAHLQRARALEPENAAVPGLLADVYATAGRFAEGQTAVEEALRLRPDDPDLLALRAELAQAGAGRGSAGRHDRSSRPVDTGDLARAEQAARAALALSPRHARALTALAAALRAQGRTAEALAALEPLLNAPDAGGASLLTAAQLARQLGQTARADDLTRRYTHRQARQREVERLSYRAALNPGDPDLHYRLGRVYLAAGDTPRAVVELRRALELRPGWDAARRELARARAANGE
jgi:tetratricopeptide (TPR) repeat protein